MRGMGERLGPLPRAFGCVRLPRLSSGERPLACSNGQCPGCRWRQLVLKEAERSGGILRPSGLRGSKVLPGENHGALARRRGEARRMGRKNGRNVSLLLEGAVNGKVGPQQRQEESKISKGVLMSQEIAKLVSEGEKVPTSIWLEYGRLTKAGQHDGGEDLTLDEKAREYLRKMGWENKRDDSCAIFSIEANAEVKEVSTARRGGRGRRKDIPMKKEKNKDHWTEGEKKDLNALYWEMGKGGHGLDGEDLIDAYVARFCSLYPDKRRCDVRRRVIFLLQHCRFKERHEAEFWGKFAPKVNGTAPTSTLTPKKCTTRNRRGKGGKKRGEEGVKVSATISPLPDPQPQSPSSQGGGDEGDNDEDYKSSSTGTPKTFQNEQLPDRAPIFPTIPSQEYSFLSSSRGSAQWERGADIFRMRRRRQG